MRLGAYICPNSSYGDGPHSLTHLHLLLPKLLIWWCLTLSHSLASAQTPRMMLSQIIAHTCICICSQFFISAKFWSIPLQWESLILNLQAFLSLDPNTNIIMIKDNITIIIKQALLDIQQGFCIPKSHCIAQSMGLSLFAQWPSLSLTWDPLGPNSAFICPAPLPVHAALHIACYTFPGMIFCCFECAQTKACTVWALLWCHIPIDTPVWSDSQWYCIVSYTISPQLQLCNQTCNDVGLRYTRYCWHAERPNTGPHIGMLLRSVWACH